MNFNEYRIALESGTGNGCASMQKVKDAFQTYLHTAYYNWDANRLGDALGDAKLTWEFEAQKSSGLARQVESYSYALNALERRLVQQHTLLSLLNKGDQAYRIATANPKISEEAWTHIFHGEVKGSGGNQTHVGLHSMLKILTNGHSSKKTRDEITVNVTDRDPVTGIYQASVTIFAKPKKSTFFPDSWTEQTIRTCVTQAAKYWIANAPEAKSVQSAASTLVKWAGRCYVQPPGGNPVILWVGGLGDPSTSDGIKTAYPQFKGSFDP